MRRHLQLFAILALALQTGPLAADALQPQGDITARPKYVAPGVRSSADLATAVVCSNLGSIAAEINVAFIEYNGSVACNPGSLVIAPGATATLATANADALSNELACIPAPTVGQGHARIYGRQGFSTRFICTVLVLPRVGSNPVFLDKLTLYLAEGGQVSDVIFIDGFQP